MAEVLEQPEIAEIDPEVVVPQLAQKGYKVYKNEEFETFVAEMRTSLLEDLKKDARHDVTREIATNLEKDLDELGIPKATPQERYFERMKRGIRERDAQLSALLKENPDVEALKAAHEQALKNQVDQHTKYIFGVSLNAAVDKLIPEDPDETINARNTEMRRLVSAYAEKLDYRIGSDGQLILVEGALDLVDPRTNQPITLQKKLTDTFKTLFSKTEAAPLGTGKKPNPANPATTVPKTSAEVDAILAEEVAAGKFAYSSNQYYERRNALKSQYGILPGK